MDNNTLEAIKRFCTLIYDLDQNGSTNGRDQVIELLDKFVERLPIKSMEQRTGAEPI